MDSLPPPPDGQGALCRAKTAVDLEYSVQSEGTSSKNFLLEEAELRKSIEKLPDPAVCSHSRGSFDPTQTGVRVEPGRQAQSAGASPPGLLLLPGVAGRRQKASPSSAHFVLPKRGCPVHLAGVFCSLHWLSAGPGQNLSQNAAGTPDTGGPESVSYSQTRGWDLETWIGPGHNGLKSQSCLSEA